MKVPKRPPTTVGVAEGNSNHIELTGRGRGKAEGQGGG